MIHKKEKGASRSIITWQGSRQIPSSQSRSLMSSHSWRPHSPPTEWKPRTTIRNELKSTNWKWPSYPSIMQLLCYLLHNWLHSVQLQDRISFWSQNSLTSITNSTYPLSLCYWPWPKIRHRWRREGTHVDYKWGHKGKISSKTEIQMTIKR